MITSLHFLFLEPIALICCPLSSAWTPSRTFLSECYKHFSFRKSTSARSQSPICHYPSSTRWPTLIIKRPFTQHPELHNTSLKRGHIKMLIISSSSPLNHYPKHVAIHEIYRFKILSFVSAVAVQISEGNLSYLLSTVADNWDHPICDLCHVFRRKFFIHLPSPTCILNAPPNILPLDFVVVLISVWAHAVAQLVEAPRYKWEGRGFDSLWCHWKFSLI
jgi:hypothetical protein